MSRKEIEDYLLKEFYCRSRRKHLPTITCLDDYVWANSLLKAKRSACRKCPQGADVRREFADPIPDLVRVEDVTPPDVVAVTEEGPDMASSTERAEALWQNRFAIILDVLGQYESGEITIAEVAVDIESDDWVEWFNSDTNTLGQAMYRLADADARLKVKVKGQGRRVAVFFWKSSKKGKRAVIASPADTKAFENVGVATKAIDTETKSVSGILDKALDDAGCVDKTDGCVSGFVFQAGSDTSTPSPFQDHNEQQVIYWFYEMTPDQQKAVLERLRKLIFGGEDTPANPPDWRTDPDLIHMTATQAARTERLIRAVALVDSFIAQFDDAEAFQEARILGEIRGTLKSELGK